MTFNSTGGGNLQDVTIADTTDFDIAAVTVDGTLSVTSGGKITQSGGITAPNLQVIANGGSVILGPAPSGPSDPSPLPYSFANHVGTISGKATGNTAGTGNPFYFEDQDPLTIGTATADVTTENGNVTWARKIPEL